MYQMSLHASVIKVVSVQSRLGQNFLDLPGGSKHAVCPVKPSFAGIPEWLIHAVIQQLVCKSVVFRTDLRPGHQFQKLLGYWLDLIRVLP